MPSANESHGAGAPSDNEHVARAAGVVGSATLLSRILGYVRDMVMASLFGAGLASDAFIAAFRIPNLLRRLVGEGTLSIAFIPVFTDCLNHQGRDEAEHLANSALQLLMVAMLMVSVLGVLAAPGLVHLLAYGFTGNPEKYALCVSLTRIMFPYIIFISLVSLCMGILNVLDHFAAPALAPSLLNIAMIAAVGIVSWLSASQAIRVTGLAVGVLIGGLLQLGLQVPFLIKKKIYFWKRFPKWHPALKQVMILMGPSLFGAAVLQINTLVITLLGSFLPQGSISYLYYADRLVQFPLGIFAIAMATAVLPTLSHQASMAQWDALQSTFAHSFKLVFFITLPSMAGLIVLREPIVALLFQRGEFSAETTRLTAGALLYYGIGLWAFSAVRIVLSTFYAMKDMRTPAIMAVVCIVANGILGVTLMWPMEHNGLALSLSLASMLNLVLLTMALRKKLGALGWRHIALSTVKSGLCALLMGLGVRTLAQWLIPPVGSDWPGLLIGIMACIAAGIMIFIGLAFAFRAPELQVALELVIKRKDSR